VRPARGGLRRAHRALRVAAVAAVVGLGAALVVATAGDDGRRRLAVGGTETTTTAEPNPATSETPTTTEEPAATSTTAGSEPTSTTAATTTTTARAGPGLEIAVGEVTAATLTTVLVRAWDPSGFVGVVTIDFGDGWTTDSYHEFYPGFKPCRGGASALDFDFTHAYRVPGTYTVSAFLERCTGAGPQIVRASPVLVRVVPPPDGRLPSNGPREPMVGVTVSSEWKAGQALGADAGGDDRDGFTRVFWIDWGDGSAPIRIERPLTDCRDTPSSYPKDDPGIGDKFEHVYLAPGTYYITATVESTGCDGGSVQTARTEPKEVTIS
jgi:hypothetical protein